MEVKDALGTARYVVDASGTRTDVLIPYAAWLTLLRSWKRLVEEIEDAEDLETLEGWLADQAAGRTETMSLEALERELIADGLLPG